MPQRLGHRAGAGLRLVGPARKPADSAPVVIVGAGPVGMTLALELAMRGVRSLIVERNAATTTFPKMDITNARSMELLRALGVVDDIRAAGVGPEHSFDVVFASGLDGTMYARWKLPSQAAMRETIAATYDGSLPREPWQRITQERMEGVLMRHCLAHPLIDVRRPWRLVGFRQDDAGVTSTIVRSDGSDECTLRSSYLVGCDGAHSMVRKSLGVTLDGRPNLVGTSCQVHFRSRDRETLQRFGQFWHLFMARRAGRASIIAQDEVDTWTLQAAVPPNVSLDDIDPFAFTRERTQSNLTIDRILHHTLWRPQALVAERYRGGRVLLAGDAAHQVIPMGGYGMNSGIADAVDLGWKLAAVIGGWGGPSALESYEVERRPVAEANRDRSIRHYRVHTEAGAIVGDQEHGPEQIGLRLARHYLTQRGENESAGLELGYSYGRSPIVLNADGELPPPVIPADPMHYVPTTTPGSRAPHVWLADGVSILDRYRAGFTLVDGSDDDRGAGLLAAARAAGIPIEAVHLREQSARDVYERPLVLVRPDGHVAWRSDRAPRDPEGVLARVTGRGATVRGAVKSTQTTDLAL